MIKSTKYISMTAAIISAMAINCANAQSTADSEPKFLILKVAEQPQQLVADNDAAAGGIWDKTKEGAGNVWDGTKEVTSDVWDGTKEVTSDVWDGTKEVTGDVWEGAKTVGSDVKNGLTGNGKPTANAPANPNNN